MATGRPTTKKEKLLQLIECPICLNELEEPRLLSCRHTLCYKCANDYNKKCGFDSQLPCPLCRQVTHLYQGSVDSLPDFFFMKTLKEVIMADDDDVSGDMPPPAKSQVVCHTEDCTRMAITYCTQGCQFMCQGCYDDHQSIRFTKSHRVIPASEGEALTKTSKTQPEVKPKSPPAENIQIPVYPPCHRHQHQVMDLYCRTCNVPICNTCSNSNHRDHDFIELEEQAKVCKVKLEEVCEDTDGLIHAVRQAIDKTNHQVQQAEVDINDACENVKSTFKILHDKLDEDEKEMLHDLQAAGRRVKRTASNIEDNQKIMLSKLESSKYYLDKLTEKGTSYDHVTVTETSPLHKELPGFLWNSKINRSLYESVGLDLAMQLTVKESADQKQVDMKKEVRKISLVAPDKGWVKGLVVHNKYMYVVHHTGLTVYCYKPDGSLHHTYEHKGGAETTVQGMCLTMLRDTPMLVISDFTNKALVWMTINSDFTVVPHHTQPVDYRPKGSYIDRGDLTVCDADNHRIHRYRRDGHPPEVITLPSDVAPSRLTRHGDGDGYVIADAQNGVFVVTDRAGRVAKRYKGRLPGEDLELGSPSDVICDSRGRLLVADFTNQQLLLLNKDGNKAEVLQDMSNPSRLCLSHDNSQLYIQAGLHHVLVYSYRFITGDKTFTQKCVKLSMTVEM